MKLHNLIMWQSGHWKKVLLLLPFFCLFTLSSCYSFTGSSLSPETKTIQIKEFINNANLVNPTMAQQFTIDMNNRFLQRTTLKGTIEKPDILIEGEIIDYVPSAPASVSSNSIQGEGGIIQTSQNKMTITVKIHYENRVEPDKSFDRTYSDESVFSSDLDINQIENSQIKIVTERIINKIFNDIVANW